MIFGVLESYRRVDMRPTLKNIIWLSFDGIRDKGPKGAECELLRQWHDKNP